MLEGTIETPFGHVKKQTAVLLGGALAVLIGVVWYRSKKQAQADATASAGANTGIDPATGYAFGSAEDAAALSNQGAYVMPQPYYSGSGSGNYVGGSSSGGPGGFTSNAQWAQYVETYLQQQNLVVDSSKLISALGRYLAGLPATAEQQDLIHQAIAVGNNPPVAGANGYPPNINTASTPDPSAGKPPGQVTGLRVTRWGKVSADFAWAPTANATSYVISNGMSGTREVPGTEAGVGGALGGDIRFPYTFRVMAKNSKGTGPESSVTLQTPGATG